MRQAGWYKDAIIYQVHVRTFSDSNGDGIGDFQGLAQKLDYVQELGVTTLWLMPFYPSPLRDDGYDISDYRSVHPSYGTLEDFKTFLSAAHDRGIRVIIEMVANHTSDQHSWFLESRSSQDNPKRDWYIWHDPAPGGGPPNNWLSEFGGGAWQYDAATSQYYYHAFLAAQPDLNWRNPKVRAAMYDVMRFWLRRG